MAERIRVARIGAAHGIRGEVKLWSFTEDPAAVADYGPLEIAGRRAAFRDRSACARRRITSSRGLPVSTTREAAEALRNLDLYVPRERLPEIDEADTFYHADLVGLAAVTADGEDAGHRQGAA